MKLHELNLIRRIRRTTWPRGAYIEAKDIHCNFERGVVGGSYCIAPIEIVSVDWEYFEEEKPKIENRVLTFYRYTYFDLGRKEFTQSPWTTEHWPVSMFISSSRNLIEVETKKVAMAIPSKGGIEFKATE